MNALRGFGAAGGLWGQVGVQINPVIGVYYQTHAMAGGVTGPVYGYWFPSEYWLNEVMIDFTYADVFQVGVGPSLDVVAINGLSLVMAGADFRLGAILFGRKAKSRFNLLVGVDFHSSFLVDSGVIVAFAALPTIGAGWY